MRINSIDEFRAQFGSHGLSQTQKRLQHAIQDLEQSNNRSKPEKAASDASQQRTRRGEIEGEEQSEVVDDFRTLYPDVGHLLIHIPNGGSRKNRFEGYRLKKQGVRAGVSDLFLPVARGGFHGLWIEFKATPPFDASVTDSQKVWIREVREQGYQAEIALGYEAAMALLRSYMDLPPTTVTAVEQTSFEG